MVIAVLKEKEDGMYYFYKFEIWIYEPFRSRL